VNCKVWEPNSQLLDLLRDLIRQGYKPIVEINQNLELFQSFPQNSLIALFNSDEKFDFSISETCLRSDVFAGLIRQYVIQKSSVKQISLAILNGFFESLRIRDRRTPRRTLGWLIEGIGMTLRQRKIAALGKKFGKTTINLPLGYTDFFVESYNQEIFSKFNKEITAQESLLSFALNNSELFHNKKINFIFIGQIGQIVRQYAIEALKRFDSKRIVLRNGYGGVSNDENRKLRIGEEYVSGLMDSRVSVCPPGNISGNSYRIMESLLCGAYPAVMSNVLCDPQFESPVIEVLQGTKPRTWSRYLKKLEKVSKNELQQKVAENLQKFRDEINLAKLEIEAIQARN
jgi:hypothetical protein